MSIWKKTAATAAVAAIVAAPFAAAQTASAQPFSGTCTAGDIRFDTSPLGLVPSIANGTISGNISGCSGSVADSGVVHGTFTADNASCFNVPANLDATISWLDGRTTQVSGPFEVPGGAGAPATNSLNIVGGSGAGGRVVVAQGPVNGASQVGPCVAGASRQGELPITSVSIG
ncbi:hypothetical protein [Nocardia arthritidis]|uniref:Protein activator n=1 Tax=Nocardia arthritidis TaxID=228602 RepID=A0A6G9YGQ9_9NOCA|nr:hypothetical protein [Nocardia arthritidis]QIS12475.1 hypothetical protein F5544_23070 [Nocardia arthritidis]